MQIDLNTVKNVYIIGIGGIGISAIARFLYGRGVQVSGSDRDASRVTEGLGILGIEVFIGSDVSHIPVSCDCILYTVAIPENHPDIIEAKKRGIPMLTYPQALKQISQDKKTIAISGTHGKTTTTAMLATILIDTGVDPSVIVGSLMKDSKGVESNFISGASDYLVVEADEYKKSFHSLYPKILVITNIDEDHLDFYKDLTDIQNSFIELAKRVPTDGYLICNISDPHLAPVIQSVNCKIVDYSAIEHDGSLKVPGEHNRSNARAALAAAQALGISLSDSVKSVVTFSGVWRRFEYKGKTEKGALVYDDYAHNPHKVRSVLAGAREFFGKDKKIIAVFQPHLFSRTKTLFNEFVKSFDDADEIVFVPIYPAREAFDPSISSEQLAEELKKRCKTVSVQSNFEDLLLYLKGIDKEGIVFMTIGAGDINTVSDRLLPKK